MLEKYVSKGSKKLRCGFTTGTCAAAASAGAARMLLSGKVIENITVITPSGNSVTVGLTDIKKENDYVSCAVQKDSGDDPDVTDKILVYSTVSYEKSGITVDGGEGVGRVTKKGLKQQIGEAAINPVPRKMIEEQLKTAASDYSYDGGLKAVISVPMGIQIAKKTFNPRLGIEGGISILGTTGIVEPMSEQALIDTISVELDVRKAQNEEFIIVTPGNYGQDFLRDNLGIAVDKCVKCSNFIGDTIDMCIEKGFKSMLLVGHIGKLSKLGCTIYNTHSRYADGRMEAFALCAALCGAEREVLENILGCITTDAALEILKKEGIFDETIKMLEKRIDRSLKLRAKGSIEIGMITFSEEYGILCKTENADNMLKKLK
ncbi:cobalt-precorrin-5B (C(1))-methyltransferase CbiD [Lachnospira hominis (ex Hitch et al. 2024)]|jgi:cobalt-precorrin-5B (C1)-methyltransferase|uniref:Cobalt-precorrin-5B C(1)-methyltransferase n=1 Tax=Lachnospira intestinalis TaxID=3133158 RepID=A0ABV1GJW6_9FIRM